MVFTSPIFIFMFLPIVLFTIFLIRDRFKNIFLLGVSLLFYAWGEPKFVIIMLISIMINYSFGLWIDNAQNSSNKKKALMAGAIVTNLGLLLVFKYGNFVVDNFNNIFNLVGMDIVIKVPKIALPIGISFFTFQGLSYVIDVYRKEVEVQKSIVKLALYISFFPQLIAGPIVRYSDIEKEINHRVITLDHVYQGLRRFIVGFAKKMLLANQVGSIADQIFAIQGNNLTTAVAWLGIICYTLQIYYDFSAYSDMAIGLGRVFGFTFMENFNYPYISRSIKEFWNRWHISLSTWFRDYLYIPLGGSRCSKIKTYRNQIIVFALSGLWHGASWTFLIWGVYYGVFLVIERVDGGRILNKIWKPLRNVYALLVIMIGWVIFRSDNISYALQYIKAMIMYKPSNNLYYPSLYLNNKMILILIIAILFAAPITRFFNMRIKRMENLTLKFASIGVVNIGSIILFVLSLIVLSATTYNPFIYFRF